MTGADRWATVPVVVGDIEVDAALVEREGRVVALVLRSGQTFENAVDAVLALRTGLHPDAVRSLVRRNLPHIVDLTASLPADPPSRRRRRVATLPAVAAMVLSLAAVIVVALGWEAVHGAEKPQASAITTLADQAGLVCRVVGARIARCTDPASGRLMLAEESTGPNTSLVTLGWGEHRVLAKLFDSEPTAQAWAQERATVALYGRVAIAGSWAVWGTDKAEVDGLVKALQTT
ncbi:MAG TPA: hypothetical protein VFP72_14965 [Kineosporiaceae bacterium]|nr:hypothetical protein [Kineosporiaceae bacterium]